VYATFLFFIENVAKLQPWQNTVYAYYYWDLYESLAICLKDACVKYASWNKDYQLLWYNYIDYLVKLSFGQV